MIDNTLKINILEKILNSKTFNNVEKYRDLLTYLVNTTISKKVPKEYCIAIDVFNRDSDFNPSEDTIVRYYMYRLRQKINAYYEDEGKDEKTRLVIPKGHYEVKFQPRSELVKKRKLISTNNLILIIIIIILLSTSSFYYYKYNSLKNTSRVIENTIVKDDPIWSSFFANNLPNTLLIGNHFSYWEYDNELERSRLIIDYETNLDNFSQLKKEYPNRELEMVDQGSLPLNSIFNLNDLSNVFYSFNKRPNIEFTSVNMASQFDLTTIIDRNIIYIGGFKYLRQVNNIFNKMPITYQYDANENWKGQISIREDNPDSLITFKSCSLKDNRYSDLGLIAKLPGYSNENYLIMTGYAYPAQIEVIRMLSSNNTLSNIYDQTGQKHETFPEYFFMIVEVICLEYIVLETNIKYFKEFSVE